MGVGCMCAQRATDRLSTSSSRSVTLFSMRKMSISSWENIWAMVLQRRAIQSASRVLWPGISQRISLRASISSWSTARAESR